MRFRARCSRGDGDGGDLDGEEDGDEDGIFGSTEIHRQRFAKNRAVWKELTIYISDY